MMVAEKDIGRLGADAPTALSSASPIEPASPSRPSGLQSTGATVATGPYAGHPIRKARKTGKCAGFRQCGTTIQPGDRYVEGDSQYDIAGGFGHERLCFSCAGAVA